MQTALYKKYHITYSRTILPRVITYEDQYPENAILHHRKRSSRIFVTPPRILVVENNLISQGVLTEILGSIGCKVDIADDGYEAIAMSHQKNYDLILINTNLPKLNGLAVIRTIRSKESDKKHTIIVAITEDESLLDKKYLEVDIDDVYIKPVLLDGLTHILQYWLPSLLLPNNISGN